MPYSRTSPFKKESTLTHCAEQGMSKCILRVKARLLLAITRYLKLADRPNDTISIQAIEKAATRWSSHNWPPPKSSHASCRGNTLLLRRLDGSNLCLSISSSMRNGRPTRPALHTALLDRLDGQAAESSLECAIV